MFYSSLTNEGTHELLHYGCDESIDPMVWCNPHGVYLYPTILGRDIVKYMPQIGDISPNQRSREVSDYSYIDFAMRGRMHNDKLCDTTVQYRITEVVDVSDAPIDAPIRESTLFGTRIYDHRGLCIRHITPSQTVVSNSYYSNDVEGEWGAIERTKITKVHDMIRGDIVESNTSVNLQILSPQFLYDRIKQSTIIRDTRCDKGYQCLDVCYEYMPLFGNNFVHYLSDDDSHVKATKKEFIYTHGDAESGFVIYLYKYYNKSGIYRLKRIYSYDGCGTAGLFLFSYKNSGEVITMTKFRINKDDRITLTNLINQNAHPTCIDKILHNGESIQTLQNVVSRKHGRIIKLESVGKSKLPTILSSEVAAESTRNFNFDMKYDRQGRLVEVSYVCKYNGKLESSVVSRLIYADNPLEKLDDTNLLSSVSQSYHSETDVKGKKQCTTATTTVDFIYIPTPRYTDVNKDIQKVKEILAQEK